MAEKEYIERDMYYQEINELSKGGCGDYSLYRLAINDCMNVLDKMPASDVAPVKHGHWNVGYFHDRVCSFCLHPDNDLNDFPHDYCPNCGAKMDGGDLNGS